MTIDEIYEIEGLTDREKLIISLLRKDLEDARLTITKTNSSLDISIMKDDH